MQPPPLNEKVLKDKRKKLKETLDRVLKMYVSMQGSVRYFACKKAGKFRSVLSLQWNRWIAEKKCVYF